MTDASDPPSFDFAPLEVVERDAWLDLFAAAPAGFATGAGLSATRVGSAGLFAIRAVPLVQFNHAHALGLDTPIDERTLDAVIATMEAKASPAWSIQLPALPQYKRAAGWLKARGLEAHGRWAKFSRLSVGPPLSATTSLQIREVGPYRAVDFGTVVQQGFGAPPPFASWASAIVGRPGWRAYVAYDGATPAAAGALFLSKDLGWLGLGSTIPSHRGRGAQGALLSRRIADAFNAGAHTVVTETGRPEPGEEASHPSFRNILRAGFKEIYVRVNYRASAE